MAPSPPTSTLEGLTRLAAKPGVRSTLILSKSDGSIIKSTGFLENPPTRDNSIPPSVGNGLDHNNTLEDGNEEEGKSKSAEHVASMVFKFVAVANEFADGLDKGNDARLLRMRTRKSEIVIALDPKFLSVVIHDAPSV
ncbi:MAG: hypothetical protein LQ352_007307 [Teloschistes flavicans]|nr:MAG: hypothetical protein LQ352_007307 [Teloschistes flavicans]